MRSETYIITNNLLLLYNCFHDHRAQYTYITNRRVRHIFFFSEHDKPELVFNW